MDETGHIVTFLVNLIVRVEKGKGKWVRIINIIIHSACLGCYLSE